MLAFALLAALAPCAPCLELTGGVRAGAGGSLFTGAWVDGLRGELTGLGAGTVREGLYLSWRLGGWVEVPVLDFLSVRAEADLGPVGGALLASDGYDMLVGVSAFELAVPALAVTRISFPLGRIVLGAGIFAAAALPVREIWNDGVVRSAGDLAGVLACLGIAGGAGYEVPVGAGAITFDLRVLASLLSVGYPMLDGMLNTVSIGLTAGWAFKPRGAR
jgi:hypothetical protein